MRVAPALAGGGEIIRRNTGNRQQLSLVSNQIALAAGPDIGAVMRNKDRHVAKQEDATFVGGRTHRLPGLVDAVLFMADQLQLDRKLGLQPVECLVITIAIGLRPGIPGFASVQLLDQHVGGEVIQPVGVVVRPILKRSVLNVGQGSALGQQPGIEGIGRQTLIGRMTATRDTQGQHLPDALPGSGEKIQPAGHVIIQPAGGQTGWVQQDTAASACQDIHVHVLYGVLRMCLRHCAAWCRHPVAPHCCHARSGYPGMAAVPVPSAGTGGAAEI